jgi:hypothetical protein
MTVHMSHTSSLDSTRKSTGWMWTPHFRYEVRVEGRPLISTFVSIAQRVFEAVMECETGKPRTRGERYPIMPIPAGYETAWAASYAKRSASAYLL